MKYYSDVPKEEWGVRTPPLFWHMSLKICPKTLKNLNAVVQILFRAYGPRLPLLKSWLRPRSTKIKQTKTMLDFEARERMKGWNQNWREVQATEHWLLNKHFNLSWNLSQLHTTNKIQEVK